MKKEPTQYTLGKEESGVVAVFKDGVSDGYGVVGVASALEIIFVQEGSCKKDWYIEEDGVVFRVDREEYGISKDREDEL